MKVTLKEIKEGNYKLIDICKFNENNFIINYQNASGKEAWIKASGKTFKSLNLGNLKSVGNGLYRPITKKK